MKRIIFLSAFGFALGLMGCEDTKENLKTPVSEKEHYKTIGEEIPFETGMEWIEHYEKTSDQGRIKNLSPYNVPASELNAMLTSVPDLTGVAFHYGIDDVGETHIMALPVDGSLSVWSSLPGRIIIDANTGESISHHEAYVWAQNYKSVNPSAIWFHFFGKDIFDDMNTLPYFDTVALERAINVLDLTPQLLLVVWNEESNLNGRTMDAPATVYDASNACPPCAVH